MVLELFSDGLCEPINPGGTAIWAFVARNDGRLLHRASGVLGSGRRMSSNYAESYAALAAVRWALRERPRDPFVLHSDSEFVVKASLGGARAGEPETGDVVEELEGIFRPIHEAGLGRIVWIPRDLNTEPDELTWVLYQEVDGRTPRFGPRAPGSSGGGAGGGAGGGPPGGSGGSGSSGSGSGGVAAAVAGTSRGAPTPGRGTDPSANDAP